MYEALTAEMESSTLEDYGMIMMSLERLTEQGRYHVSSGNWHAGEVGVMIPAQEQRSQ